MEKKFDPEVPPELLTIIKIVDNISDGETLQTENHDVETVLISNQDNKNNSCQNKDEKSTAEENIDHGEKHGSDSINKEDKVSTEHVVEIMEQISPVNLEDNNSKSVSSADDQADKEVMEREMLLMYISEVELRADIKNKLRERNHFPHRPDDAALGKLDSSLKKNTAFVRKLRNFTAPQLESLLKDMSTLNLSKYNSEVASAIVEAKLKLNDVSAAVTLCSEMHTTYAEFSKLLLDHWVKTLSLKKDEKIPNPSKLRVDLRFYGDLITSGIFQYKEALPLLGNVLTVLTTSDREEHTNINIILSFCKHCGEDYAGLVPRSIRILSEKINIQVPRNSMLPPEKQKNVRSLLKDYYTSLCKHLLKEHADMQAFERQNRRILQTKGELSAERKERGENLTASFQKLYNATISFAEVLDEDIPVLPEEEGSKTDGDSFRLLTCDFEAANAGCGIWEDEETLQFYTEFPNLKDYLPNYKVVKPEKIPDTVMTEEKLDEDLKEEELEDDKKEDEVVTESIEDIEEPESNANSSNKILFEAFLNCLPNCGNKEMIDNAAIEFLMNHNTKHNRKKLVKTLFGVSRTRLDLLPFYARFVAILNPLLPDIAADLSVLLKHDFKYHVRKKDQINIESKLKVIRFIGELVKFGLYSKIEGLYCLKILLHDFSHHHIEMACSMLETCGRFFFRNPDTHQRTKVYLEQIMRMKAGKTLDARYVFMIENAYYFVSPPEQPVCQTKRPVLNEFIRHILYVELTKPEEAAKVLEYMCRLNWLDGPTSDYAIKCLIQAWNIPYPNIKDLANLLAGLVVFQEFVATRVVDGVLEDIRMCMEITNRSLYQRRVSVVKYIGELYNYRMVESSDIFKVLYSLISFGVSIDHDHPSPYDPPDHLFRIRLVCTLLETCGQYFNYGPSKTKLDCFFIYFQYYYWFKHTDPIWTEGNPFPTYMTHMFRDTLLNLRANFKFCESFQEAKDSADQLIHRMRLKYVPLLMTDQTDNNELGTIVETPTENETEEDGANGDISDEENESDYEKGAVDLDEDSGSLSKPTFVDRESDDIRDGAERQDWSTEDYLLMDSDNDLSDNQKSRSLSPDDHDFLTAFDKMISDNLQDRMKDNVKPQQVDIPVPLHVKTNVKKTYEQLQEPEAEDKETVNFVLMLRKGNKQQYKSVAVPTDSELALNLRSQEKAERVEMEKVKKLTLDINDRLEEEDYQDQISQTQKPAMVNLNRERRHKYQHPKGAPDADLIFGRKKIQRYL